MNPDTTEQNINQAIDWLQKTGGRIQDFATEQAPLYCREVVAWELWGNTVAAIGCVVGLGLISYLFKKTKAWIAEEAEDCNPAAIFLAVGMLLSSIFLTCGFVASIGGAVKAAVAPRMVIIEHLRGIQK